MPAKPAFMGCGNPPYTRNDGYFSATERPWKERVTSYSDHVTPPYGDRMTVYSELFATPSCESYSQCLRLSTLANDFEGNTNPVSPSAHTPTLGMNSAILAGYPEEQFQSGCRIEGDPETDSLSNQSSVDLHNLTPQSVLHSTEGTALSSPSTPLKRGRSSSGGRHKNKTGTKERAKGAQNGSTDCVKLSREERRRRRRATTKYRTAHAFRERLRVEAFNVAFQDLRKLLPTLPPDKKLSKIEILRLAICYMSYLSHILEYDSYL